MKPIFNPTPDQTFELEASGPFNFIKHKQHIDKLVGEGNFTDACEARYEAFQLLVEALPEDEAMRNHEIRQLFRLALDKAQRAKDFAEST
jgi:Arc/MetJ-type ribon-helix-helix transcriptional regulator